MRDILDFRYQGTAECRRLVDECDPEDVDTYQGVRIAGSTMWTSDQTLVRPWLTLRHFLIFYSSYFYDSIPWYE